MVDNLTKETRSKVMAAIRSKDTSIELMVRRRLWPLGVRYRIHDKNVPGRPDLSVRRSKLAVFIDGCFWHGCKVCYKEPTSNTEFWRRKLKRNIQRRNEVKQELGRGGWIVLEVWEHDVLADLKAVVRRIMRQT